jgi:2,4-diaminopentanoate dehydrogenase
VNRSRTSTYRVVQWATGTIGARSLRGVVEHPNLSLAGLYVYAPEKAGRDAGDLCGLRPTGVLATRDIDDILELEADCVLYMPRECDVDAVCHLLGSGANVVTTCGEFHHPASMDPLTRERIEEACRRGSTSVHSTGSSPGFISEAVPLVLTSIQRRLDSLVIEEFADLSQRDSPDLLFELMGFGTDPAAFDQASLVPRGTELRPIAPTGGGGALPPPRVGRSQWRDCGCAPQDGDRRRQARGWYDGRTTDEGHGHPRRLPVPYLRGDLVLHI